MKNTLVPMDEIGSQILYSKLYDVILAIFQEDARHRFADEYALWADEALRCFGDPTTAYTKYNETLWQFLMARGYGERFQKVFDRIMAAIKEENDEWNLSIHHIGKVEAKKLLRKDDYAKLVKSN